MTDELKQPMARDEQLIRLALGGHAAAFGTLVERYWKMVVAMALTRMADPTTTGHGEPLYDGNLLNRQDERKGATIVPAGGRVLSEDLAAFSFLP